MSPSLLRSIILLLMITWFSHGSLSPSSPCYVDCSSEGKCTWERDNTNAEITYKVSCMKFARVDGVFYTEENKKFFCTSRKYGSYWRDTDIIRPDSKDVKWMKINKIECFDEIPCLYSGSIVSSCRSGLKVCNPVPLLDPRLLESPYELKCSRLEDTMFVMEPNTTKARKVYNVVCDVQTGIWKGYMLKDVERSEHDDTKHLLIGSNIYCIREPGTVDHVDKWNGEQGLQDITNASRASLLLSTLYFAIAGAALLGYALYIWWKQISRHHRYLMNQDSLLPQMERTAFFSRGIEDTSLPIPPPDLPAIPTVPLEPENDVKKSALPSEIGLPGGENDARAPSEAFLDGQTAAKKKKKKKQKEQIGDDQYESVVAIDKYCTRNDRIDQKIEDFSEDDLEESWRQVMGPAPGGASKYSKMSTKNYGLNSRAHAAMGLSKKMAESIKAAEEPGGMIPSYAESNGSGFQSKESGGQSTGASGGQSGTTMGGSGVSKGGETGPSGVSESRGSH